MSDEQELKEKERKLRDSITSDRWEMAKRCAEIIKREEWGSEAFDVAAFALWFALSGAQRESLEQIMFNGPVWDGDHISKAARDDLFQLGLLTRCLHKGESGHTAAKYSAETVYRAASQHKERKLEKLREKRKQEEAISALEPDGQQQSVSLESGEEESQQNGPLPNYALVEFMQKEGAVKWEGGECPVAPNVTVEFMYSWGGSHGVEGPRQKLAADVNWTGKVVERPWGATAPALAYRIIETDARTEVEENSAASTGEQMPAEDGPFATTADLARELGFSYEQAKAMERDLDNIATPSTPQPTDVQAEAGEGEFISDLTGDPAVEPESALSIGLGCTEIPDGFKPWNGDGYDTKGYPEDVRPGVHVDYIMRNGKRATTDQRHYSYDATYLRWFWRDDTDDIIAYRVISEALRTTDPKPVETDARTEQTNHNLARDLALGTLAEIDARAEAKDKPRTFGGIFGFGNRKPVGA